MLGGLMRALASGKGRAIAAAATAALGLAVFAVSHAATETAQLLKVRLGGDSATTRIVIDLDGAASARVISDGAADRRVVIQLGNVAAPASQQGASHGLIKDWMVEQAAGGARLSMDLAAAGKVKRRFLLPPADGIDHYRYVIDVAAISGAAQASARATKPKTAPKPQVVAAKAPLPLKKIVVVDAGHGGKDVGAIGSRGYEKDINLAAALALKARLEQNGRYQVVMTRKSDVYIPLETRVRIAQRANADLFISLHSDSGPDATLRGASVYTLADRATGRAQKFINSDDWFMKASLTGDQSVRDILFDLTQRATRNRSAVFAQTLVSNLDGKAPLLRRSQRDAGFMVLLAPDVPAVLLEMGFVSNPEDEARLRDSSQRRRLADAIAQSIDAYFKPDLRLASR
jgi:N-acetylmuramoyl-L-alanine amidase